MREERDMPTTGGFDAVTQLRGDVLTDILIRLLGDASTQDPTSSNYVARQLIYPPAPLEPQAMLWWDDPKVTVSDGEHATLSVAVTGGVRQAASALDSGRIGSVSGTLTASLRPLLATTAGTPHLSLALDALDVRGLRVKYGESNAIPLVAIGGTPAPLGQAIVEALARDVLASAMVDALLRSLLTGLGRLPLVYSTALTTVETARTGAALRIFGERDGSVIAIGAPLPGMTGDVGRIENALAGRTDSNVAMTVTSVAVTAGAMRLLTTGKVARQLRATNGAEARLDSLGVQAHDGYVTLTAHLSSGPVSGTALLNATLTLDRAAASLQLGVSAARGPA
jgi:hypothetical protein